MTLLPPVGWADVATKHDLLAGEGRLEIRMDGPDGRMERFEGRTERLEIRVDALSSRLITWLVTSQATGVAATAAMIPQR